MSMRVFEVVCSSNGHDLPLQHFPRIIETRRALVRRDQTLNDSHTCFRCRYSTGRPGTCRPFGLGRTFKLQCLTLKFRYKSLAEGMNLDKCQADAKAPTTHPSTRPQKDCKRTKKSTLAPSGYFVSHTNIVSWVEADCSRGARLWCSTPYKFDHPNLSNQKLAN